MDVRLSKFYALFFLILLDETTLQLMDKSMKLLGNEFEGLKDKGCGL